MDLVLQVIGAKPQLVNQGGLDGVNRVMPTRGREGLGPSFFGRGFLDTVPTGSHINPFPLVVQVAGDLPKVLPVCPSLCQGKR